MILTSECLFFVANNRLAWRCVLLPPITLFTALLSKHEMRPIKGDGLFGLCKLEVILSLSLTMASLFSNGDAEAVW